MTARLVARLLRAALAATLACLALAAQAAWPERSVTVIVPYPAGGGTDTVARSLAVALSQHWNQPVVVENVAGADGMIGTNRVLRATPDGYTVLMQVNQMLLYKSKPPAKGSPMDELRLVSMVQHSPLAFAVSSRFPGDTFQDFVRHCRSAKCSWASATRYGELIGNQLMDASGLGKLAVHTPYKGTTPMVTDLIGEHITLALPAVASGLPQVKAGNLKFLAVGSRERFPIVPDTPTLAEQGLPVYGDSWYGLMVRKDTPPPVFDAIVQAVRTVSTNAALLKSIESNAGVPVFSTPEQFTADVAKEQAYLDGLLQKFPLETN